MEGSPLPIINKSPFRVPSGEISPEYSNCVIHLNLPPRSAIEASVESNLVVEAGIRGVSELYSVITCFF